MSTNRAPDVEIARLIDRLLRRINGELNADAARFDRHDVGPHGGMLLLTLAELQPARIQDLVSAMARDKSQMTRAIKSLEAKGLIARAGVEGDGRVSMLSLTDEGKLTVAALQQAVAEALMGILSPLSADEHETLKALLARL
ncbi:MAG: MarR family transcriptional regulator [Pseudomonadota bacterium]